MAGAQEGASGPWLGCSVAQGALVPAPPACGRSKCAGLSVCLDTHLALVLWLDEDPGHPRCPLSPPGHALAGWEVGDLDSVALSMPGACTPGPIVKTPPRGEGQDFPPARPRDPHTPSAPLHKGTSRDRACVRSGLPPASGWVRGTYRPQGCSGSRRVQTDPAAGVGSPSPEEDPSVKQFTYRLAMFLPKPRC